MFARLWAIPRPSSGSRSRPFTGSWSRNQLGVTVAPRGANHVRPSPSAQATRPNCLSGRRNPSPLSRYSAGTAILNLCGLGASLTSRPGKGRSALLQGSRQRTLARGGSGPWQDRNLPGFGPSSGRSASVCGTRTTFFRGLPRPRRTLTTRSSRMLPASLACTRLPPPARSSARAPPPLYGWQRGLLERSAPARNGTDARPSKGG